MKIVFVVLHYCQISVTVDCISSLLRLKGNPLVVVVDNASPDGSGSVLKERYKGSGVVHFILNNHNLGFARANNIGYAYAKKELAADVIVVINNDTIIKDKEFVEKLLSSPFLHSHHIIAPDIINMAGNHQNPKALQPPSYKLIINNYRKAILNRLIYSIPIIGDIKSIMISSSKYHQPKREEIIEMIVPHGAAVIYTPLWINKEDIAFYPGTFMYCEESILIYYIINKHYKTVYCPDFEIIHLEDISTKSRFKNRRKRSLFQLKHSIESHRILIEYIKKNGLEKVV